MTDHSDTTEIVVIGGGPTGIETAAELADQGSAVTLVGGGRLAPAFREPARRSVLKWLSSNQVEVLEDARVAKVWPDAAGDAAAPSGRPPRMSCQAAAAVQFTHRDDTAGKLHLGGRRGGPIKEAASSGAVTGIRKEARKPGSLSIYKGAGNRHPLPTAENVTR
ncbi:FAD-dependent oxidoreductase [Nocardia nova]|uniref:FAD-dependent oxidoreductase n=1 Tax=Nocardia nova TaxID=37330 RepID=UPI003796AD1B